MVRATRSSVAKAQPAPPATVKEEPVQLSSPPSTPVPRNARKRKAAKQDDNRDAEAPEKASATPKSTKRAKKGAVKREDINDLPHGLGAIPTIPDAPSKAASTEDVPPAKKRATPRKSAKVKKEDVDDLVAKATTTTDASPKKKAKAKNNDYGLTPGKTPYPNYPRPTAEECQEVTRLLEKVHGKVEAPKVIPMPSLEVSGCGEVPSVLDALIRTRLSAATSGTNSSRAFAGLVARFGVLKSGIGKGSVDWNAVRLADTKDVFEAIKSGGLADVKSKDIKKILQMSRSRAKKTNPKEEQQQEKEKADNDVVTLDPPTPPLHRRTPSLTLPATRASAPKPPPACSSSVSSAPTFAVDTHVFRLCKWLGWVPSPGDPAGLPPNAKPGAVFPGANRNSTYAHCEVRVPDDLKYPLHQLLIRHGKSCPRCRAITSEGSAGWDEGCPIEHLVKRSGGRKGDGEGTPVKAKAKSNGNGKGKKKAVVSDDESEAAMSATEESSELSDLGSDDEVGAESDVDDED
ncbi:hypothetical protein SNOG_07828 [Parastagonospora nodorum SN15]|uniref:HhH-GPD domain-containing protein n=1 Tax=Phaeosphaeria nodorum (strain SN15 / ATCC MYA-4574 / FGSC 10173) TaxID=321614 RepID=Q0UK86_PHANO|nr:hypothetical protein SNOG_07828 [Parastagonospora nodorum SN15]EAT85294.1 hypothetical protein SNOG_07828 [Parastagonospora nodorum SN15]